MRLAYLISQNPVLTLSDVLRQPKADLPEPLDRPDVTFFGYARAALYVGLKRLGIQPGDNILLPSLICDVVMAPLNHLGVEGRFYDSDRHLRPILCSAKEKLDRRTRAFLAVNYFGFPQDLTGLQSFCQQNGLYFIEDSAHCFLSGIGTQPLGTFGDIGVVSFRKTVPVPNGAALIVNNRHVRKLNNETEEMQVSAPDSAFSFVLRQSLRYAEKYAQRRLVRPLKEVFWQSSKKAGSLSDEEINMIPFNQPLSTVSQFLIRRFDLERIRQQRRFAFEFWKEEIARRFKTAVALFPEIPEGAVPMAFPFIATDYFTIQHDLNKLGVECIAWPERFPRRSHGWSHANRILLVPLHWLPNRKQLVF